MEEFRSREEILGLFESLGIEYLPRPEIRYEPLLDHDPESVRYYRDNRKEFERLARKYGPSILSRRTASVYVARTERMGYGLFAAEPLAKGTFIGEYTGIVKQALDAPAPDGEDDAAPPPEGYATDYAWGYPDCVEGVSLEIDAKHAGNELRFVNHSFRPNLAVEHTAVGGAWAVFFIAKKRIPRGGQLYADYGIEYWSGGYRELVVE